MGDKRWWVETRQVFTLQACLYRVPILASFRECGQGNLSGFALGEKIDAVCDHILQLTTFRFTGERQETGLGPSGGEGLYWVGSRWLDPSIMRWTSPDTIIPGVGEGGNPNAVGCLGVSNYSPLTVDYHENQLLEQLNLENGTRLQNHTFRLPPVPINSIAFDRYAYSMNNPVRYTDPTGHCPFCVPIAISLGAITPVGWVAIGLAVGAAVVIYAVGPENFAESVVNLGEQAGEAASNGLNALFAKKPDVAYGDYLAKKYGLDRAGRRALHDWITKQRLSNEEIEEEAEEFARLLRKKQKNTNQNDDQEGEGENER